MLLLHLPRETASSFPDLFPKMQVGKVKRGRFKKRPIIADSQQSLKSADTASDDTTRRVEQAVEWIVDDSSFAPGD